MPGDNPTEPTPDHKPETKATPRPGPRKPRSSADDQENLPVEGDEPETDSTGSEKDEPSGARERAAAPHKAGQTSVETKKAASAAAESSKTLGLAGRVRFRRRIKPRR